MRRLIIGFALVLIFAGNAQADVVVLKNDDQLTLDSYLWDGLDLYDTSQVSIIPGGYVSIGLNSYDSSTVNISGGLVRTLKAYGSSNVKMSSGSSDGYISVNGSSTGNISGGSVKYSFYVRDYGTLDLSGGVISSNLHAQNFSTVDISGGTIRKWLYAIDSSTVNMSGGSAVWLDVRDSSTLTLNVREFELVGLGLSMDGERLLGTGTINCEWVDATSSAMSVATNSGAGIFISIVMDGDANCDGVVDEKDAALLAANWQTLTGATWRQGDFNADGAVNDIDATLLAANWQSGEGTANVPEPTTLLMLVMGAAALLVFRRR